MAAHPTKIDLSRNGLELHDFAGNMECSICLEPLLTPANTPPPVTQQRFDELKLGNGASTTTNSNAVSPQRGIQHYQHTSIKIKACGHVFGVKCLQHWLLRSRTCPVCRRELFPDQTFAEYQVDLMLRKPAPATLMTDLDAFEREDVPDLLEQEWDTLQDFINQARKEDLQWLREKTELLERQRELMQMLLDEARALNALGSEDEDEDEDEEVAAGEEDQEQEVNNQEVADVEADEQQEE